MVQFFKDLCLTKCLSLKLITPYHLINQLLSVTRVIYKSFDDEIEVRGVLLEICNTFDKVWHDEFIFKLEQNGISGEHSF